MKITEGFRLWPFQAAGIFIGVGTYRHIRGNFLWHFRAIKLLLIGVTNRIDTYSEHQEFTLWVKLERNCAYICINVSLKSFCFALFPQVNGGLYSPNWLQSEPSAAVRMLMDRFLIHCLNSVRSRFLSARYGRTLISILTRSVIDVII